MTPSSFSLAAQLLPVRERVLVLAEVVGLRNGDGWFSAADISALALALRIPSAANPTRTLEQLKPHGWLLRRSGPKPWALTALGRQQAAELMSHQQYEQIEAELVGTPGVEFAAARHTVLAPSFAPARWQPGISRLLDKYPFELNVFCMTRFPSRDTDESASVIESVIQTLRHVVSQHGLHLHLASDRQTEDDLFGNVGAHMWACQYGVGLLEARHAARPGLNSNVLIELGSVLVTGRRCAILKDRTAPSPPSDLSGQIYKSVDFDDLGSIWSAAHGWLSKDLGLGDCSECPSAQPRH